MMDDSNHNDDAQHDTQNDTQDDDGCTPETNNTSSKTGKEKYDSCWRIVCDIPLDDVEIIPHGEPLEKLDSSHWKNLIAGHPLG